MSTSSPNRRRVLFLALLTAAALLRSAAPVFAHAIIVSTDPADGSVLTESPKQIRLWFSEPILLDFTTVELMDGDSQKIEVTRMRLDSANPSSLVVDLPVLAPNAYRLTWRTLSTDDIHPSAGSLVFGVQQAADLAPASIAALPSPLEVILRWLNFSAIATLVGALVVVFAILPSAVGVKALQSQHSSRGRLLWLALGSSLVALAVGAGLLLVQASQANSLVRLDVALGSAQQILSQTEFGGRWILRQVLLVGLVVASAVFLRRKNRQTRRFDLMAITPSILVLLFLQALNSHAAGLEDAPLLKVAVDALHVLAASLWAGGLVALAVTMVPLLRRGEAESALAWAAFRRFGALAAVSVITLVVTGLYSSGQQVASLDALLVTLYGQSLMLKVGLTMCVGLIGLFNSALLHPGVANVLRRALRRPEGWTLIAPQQLRRTVLIEAIGAGAVLLLAALLSATQPARGPEFEPPSKEELSAPSSFTANAADLLVTVSVKPNRPGQNFISLGVFNTRRPPPARIDQVEVRLAPPAGREVTTTAESLGEGKYQIAGDAIYTPGEWQIEVRVVRPGLADVTVSTPWTVLPLQRVAARRPVLVSNAPLAPLLTSVAIGLALFFGGIGLRLELKERKAAASLARLARIRPPVHWLRKDYISEPVMPRSDP